MDAEVTDEISQLKKAQAEEEIKMANVSETKKDGSVSAESRKGSGTSSTDNENSDETDEPEALAKKSAHFKGTVLLLSFVHFLTSFSLSPKHRIYRVLLGMASRKVAHRHFHLLVPPRYRVCSAS